MRVVYGLLLLAFLGAVGIFAWQNHEPVTVQFLDRSIGAPMSLIIGACYGFGMLSGWTVVGFLKRSLRRITARPQD
jgi:uncharacterized integral membrane protein